MATVMEVVSRTLRILRVLPANSAPRPADMSDAIKALNAMMRRWEANGLGLGWSDVSNPSDDMPIPPEAEEAVAYNLALRLRGEYGVVLDRDTIALAQEGLSALRRDRKVANPLEWERTGWRYDTWTDSYL